MKRFVATIKEKGNPHILHPQYLGDVTIEFLEEFLGLNNPDVEYFSIEERDT